MTDPIMLIPTFINQIFKDLISIQRLQKYLFTEEHQGNIYQDLDEYNNNNLLVKFDNVSFCINDGKPFEINDVKKNKNKRNSELNIELEDLNTKKLLDESNSENVTNQNLNNQNKSYKHYNIMKI